ncbi:MAG: sulfotransferase domain-containing protein [Psychroflexus sp.]
MKLKKKIKNKIKSVLPHKNIDRVSVFIVGAQKAGTSALHNYLIKHHEVSGGFKKELNFFNHQENYSQGKAWYHKQFKTPLFYHPHKIYIDSTPQYLMDKSVAQKIYQYNPKAKIVVLLREPVSRAYSAWNMYKQFSELSDKKKIILMDTHIPIDQKEIFSRLINQNSFPTFEEYINLELEENKLKDQYPFIIKRGLYAEQLKPYIKLFGLDNLLIFESNVFKKNKIEITNKILSDLGLSGLDLKDEHLKSVHSRKYSSTMSDHAKQKLKVFYKPHNEKLYSLINQKFDW